MNRKTSFILYFDMYASIRGLSAEQRGALFSAIFEFAEASIQQPDCGQQILARHPELNDAAKMAFSFITLTIERDTEKWREKQARYQAAAEKRWEQRSAGEDGKSPGRSRGGDPWVYVE